MINKMKSISFYESKASCVEDSHFILYDPGIRGIKYCLFSLDCCGKWSRIYADHHILLSLMPFCFISYKVYDRLWDYVCLILFGVNACYLIVSDQQKYLKCMLCLICIEMWFKVCLKNNIHCKKMKEKSRPNEANETKCGSWSYLY